MRKLKTSRRAEILDAALDIAGEQGLSALSMRNVAARIGVTPMALYGYFRSKDDLLDGLVGRLLAELPQPDPSLHWRDQLTLIAHGARQVARRHPTTFQLLFTRPSVAPDAVRVVDRLYRALLAAGVPDKHVPRVERLLSTFLLGFALSEVSGRFSRGTLDSRERRGQIGPEELPAHHRLASTLDTAVDWEAEFVADLVDLISVIDAVASAATREK